MFAHFDFKGTQQITVFINFKLHIVFSFFGRRPNQILLQRLWQRFNLDLLLVYVLLSSCNFLFILVTLRIHEYLALVILAALP